MDASRFHVITVISNACRYKSRVRLYKDFAEHMKQSGVQLWTVEAAFGDRDHEVTEKGNPYHIQLRTRTELWHKENMINIAISRLPADAEVICWIDADVQFVRKDWAEETWHQLQHHDVVQLWSTAADLGPKTQIFATSKSFAWCYQQSKYPDPSGAYGYWHSGYAWGMHKRALEKLKGAPKGEKKALFDGPLLSYAPLGSADFYMAWGIIGELEPRLYQDVADKSMRKLGFHKDYAEHLLRWGKVAQNLNQDIGVVEGTILHFWHGKKKQRQYNSRENILIEAQFNPEEHLVKDHQGLWTWSARAPIKLRDDMRRYSRQRDEDSNDL